MPDITGFLLFLAFSGVVSIALMHGGVAQWVAKTVVNLFHSM